MQINEIFDIFLRHKNWDITERSQVRPSLTWRSGVEGHRFFVLENEKIEILFAAKHGQRKNNFKVLAIQSPAPMTQWYHTPIL